MAKGFLFTSNQFSISPSVTGVSLDGESWDKWSGGGHTSDTQNYNPGAMAPAIATAGTSKRNQATLERAWDDTLIAAWIDLDAAVGSAISIGVQGLINASTNNGKVRTYTGVIREVNTPDADSTSSNVSMLQVVVELNEQVTG